MKTMVGLLAIVIAAGHAVEVVDIPKKFVEAVEWTADPPLLVFALLLIAALAAVFFRRSRQASPAYLIEPRGRCWLHMTVTGDELGAYPSRKKVIDASHRFRADRGPAIVYIRSRNGNTQQTLEF